MKTKEKIELLHIIIMLVLGIFLLSLFLFLVKGLGEYLTYKSYYNEGYKVKWSLSNGCEMKLKNINGTIEWRSCLPAEDYIIENFGIKR